MADSIRVQSATCRLIGGDGENAIAASSRPNPSERNEPMKFARTSLTVIAVSFFALQGLATTASLADLKVKTKSNIKNDRMTTATANSSLGRVKILLESADGGAALTMMTNASGCATFSGLQPGEYKVNVSDFSKYLTVGREAKVSLCLVSNGDGADLMMNRKHYVGHVTLMK